MQKKEYLVTAKTGLHARPAAQFVEVASKFDAEIYICFNELEANAKSIISVLSLGIGQGETFKLQIEGTDEKKAFQEIDQYLVENLSAEKGNKHDFIRQDVEKVNHEGQAGD